MSCNALKNILGAFFSLHGVSYCVHMHNEKQVISTMQCDETHLRCLLFIAQMLVIACICITKNKLDMSCKALKHVLGVFFSLHRVSYCVHMHNEKQVLSIMQCNETHLRCFLLFAQRLVIACICITRNKLDRSCNAMKHILGIIFSLHRVSYCVHMHNEKQLYLSCNAMKHILGVFFYLHRG